MNVLNEPNVCVVGLGFVGLSIIECFSRKYKCIGFDISKQRINFLSSLSHLENILFTCSIDNIRHCKLFIVSVPTPLKDNNSAADLSIVENALHMLYDVVTCNATIVLESSVAIGTSERLLEPFRWKGVFCGFSPERIDLGRTSPHDWEIPKIISGYDNESLEQVRNFYSGVYDNVVSVSSMKTAEMCKLYENCFRMINIAYVNEISDACVKHSIDPLEMIGASATKPFGFMPFYPGLFVGGSCIGVNPYYLKINCDLPLLYSATTMMEERPTNKALQLIEKYHPEKVLVIGLGFKPGQSVTIGSGTFRFARILMENGVAVKYYDPLVDSDLCERMPDTDWTISTLDMSFDVIAICVKQTGIDYTILEDLTKTRVVDYSIGQM
jgi:nucleotide sugar dehydrogenase